MAYEHTGDSGVSGTGRARRRAGVAAGERTLGQILALVFGVIFLLVGIAGFVPGITGDYDQLDLLGTDSEAKLLGVFRVSVLHNIVHALFGVGILAAARPGWARSYLLGGGIVYALVVVYGVVVDHESDANFLPINDADNVLHAALTLAMLAAGVVAAMADRRHAGA